jgi:hypothetical protein
MVRIIRSNPAVPSLSSETPDEIRAYVEATRLRRTRGALNVEALIAAHMTGISSSEEERSELSDEQSYSESTPERQAEGSSPAVRQQSRFLRDSHQTTMVDS